MSYVMMQTPAELWPRSNGRRQLRKAAARASSARARRAHSRALAWRKAKGGTGGFDFFGDCDKIDAILCRANATVADPFHPELISKYEDGK